MLVLSWLRPLEWRRRLHIALLAAIVPAAILIARFQVHGFASSVVRDWLPVPLLLIPYWQAGEFFRGPNKKIELWLSRVDERVLANFRRVFGDQRLPGWAARYFETAYLLCYPLVPIGLGALYLGYHRAESDFYWVVVVLASDICFFATVFLPAMPPRLMAEQRKGAETPTNNVRKLNLSILKRGSIQAITFPSAHVASTTAVAFVLTVFMPATGVLFLAIAASIAIGAFLGGYHYFLDVAAGAAEAVAIFVVCLWILRP
jgi:membrane-associated phospholipid phosphatase